MALSGGMGGTPTLRHNRRIHNAFTATVGAPGRQLATDGDRVTSWPGGPAARRVRQRAVEIRLGCSSVEGY